MTGVKVEVVLLEEAEEAEDNVTVVDLDELEVVDVEDLDELDVVDVEDVEELDVVELLLDTDDFKGMTFSANSPS